MENKESAQEIESSALQWAKSILGDNLELRKEMSSDKNSVYEIITSSQRYFLKIGPNLEKENEKLHWLKGKLPTPNVIAFTKHADTEALIMTAVEGTNLAYLAKEWGAEKVVNKLAEALLAFHSTDISSYPLSQPSKADVLVHGDACLPNFIYKGEKLSGYIDLGDLQVGDREIDLAAAVWTLQYNFGPGYGVKFLETYGIHNPTPELAEKLRMVYENKI
jgi:kanamycin kinase